MSILKSHTSLERNELAYEVLSLPPFNEIELEDYETFLDHLIYTGHIEIRKVKSIKRPKIDLNQLSEMHNANTPLAGVKIVKKDEEQEAN